MMGKMSMAALLGATLVFVGTVNPAGEKSGDRTRRGKSFFLLEIQNRWNFFFRDLAWD